MKTRGGIKKSPVPKKGGAKTPTKGSVEEDLESKITISEQVQDAENLQNHPSADVTVVNVDAKAGELKTETKSSIGENGKPSRNIGEDSKLQMDKGSAKTSIAKSEPDEQVKVLEIGSQEAQGVVIAKFDGSKVAQEVAAEEKPAEGDISKENVKEGDGVDGDEEEEDEAEAEDEVEDEVEDEIEDEVEDMEEDEVEDEEEDEIEDEVEDEDEVDYEDEDNKVQQEIDKIIRDGENDTERTLREIQDSQPVSQRRKLKRVEVFIGNLQRDVTKHDLRSIFGKIGKVMEVRLTRYASGKNKGYAFVRYGDPSEAKRAIDELHGSQIRGQPCRVIPSEENDLLYLGNIDYKWKKENLMEALNKYKIEKLEEVTLLEDPQNKEKNRGYAFLEFTTHKDAMKAFQRLQRPDVIVGGDRSAKVAFAQPLVEPDDETMEQVRSVYVDGMPPAWNEKQVKQHFGKYGEIERITLARNRSSSKRNDFGFIDYATREAALACIEAANNSEVGEGEQKVKLKVRFSKPVFKRRTGKGGIHGNFPIQSIGTVDVGGLVRTWSPRKVEDRRGRSSGRHARVRTGRKSDREREKLVRSRSRREASREHRRRRSSLGRRSLSPRPGSKFSSRPDGDFTTRGEALVDRRGSRRDRFSDKDDRSHRESKRDRLESSAHDSVSAREEAYLHRRAREYTPEPYETTTRDLREAVRERKRGFSDLEDDPRYVEVPRTGHSRAHLVLPDDLPLAVGGSQYARIPFYEIPARAPVGQVGQYAIGQGLGLSAAPAQSYALYDPLSSAGGNTAYSASGYTYGSMYPSVAEIAGASSYVPSSYGVHPLGASRYLGSRADLDPFY
ncbi:hypothetical protein O6H91_15G063000 [Diphasiastrum complanatum]|nr:hypothetical protein O6H91_15G063000 [Diphasiastrum complanatum]KAJ7529715.1 hypothetical protein O6H91_15G063000 [Diphasiastrum complanatum]KAJ7529716.1 hypothetical protein O6H91_15G063000 [Diphasiastrum complanatum]KAJ7529717.1 hypothetical protein O6H91_15G063000 [Diphasiastrum complanatum]KAJ7529718.1 hypothetical protein O6H91_15G063000 [Diphasiastrum complanatum]